MSSYRPTSTTHPYNEAAPTLQIQYGYYRRLLEELLPSATPVGSSAPLSDEPKGTILMSFPFEDVAAEDSRAIYRAAYDLVYRLRNDPHPRDDPRAYARLGASSTDDGSRAYQDRITTDIRGALQTQVPTVTVSGVERPAQWSPFDPSRQRLMEAEFYGSIAVDSLPAGLAESAGFPVGVALYVENVTGSVRPRCIVAGLDAIPEAERAVIRDRIEHCSSLYSGPCPSTSRGSAEYAADLTATIVSYLNGAKLTGTVMGQTRELDFRPLGFLDVPSAVEHDERGRPRGSAYAGSN